jgi:cytochrome c biogenesis protein CcmG/thiol:disulfide interchange protein DsbE
VNPVLRRLLGPVALLALFGLLVAGLLRPTDSASGANTPLAGKPAPAFSLQTLDGGAVSLAQFRGRPVLINFWASWCLPCRDEAPILRAAALEHARAGLVVLGVAYNDKPQDSRAFRDEFGLGFPILMDGADGRTAVSYGLTGVPETFFVDRDGRVVARHAGPVTQSVLDEWLKAIL